MSDDKTAGFYTLTAPVVSTFPNLFEAKQFVGKNGKPNGDPKYSINLLNDADSADLHAMKAVAKAVAKAKWPNRKLSELIFPFSSGDEAADKRKAAGKDDGEYSRGKVILTARSKYQPLLGLIAGGKIVELSTDDLKAMHKDKFYSGVQVFAVLNFVAYDGPGNNPDGVTAYLQQVLSTGKGERIGGGQRSIAETFKGYVGQISDKNPLAGGEDDGDEIPF